MSEHTESPHLQMMIQRTSDKLIYLVSCKNVKKNNHKLHQDTSAAVLSIGGLPDFDHRQSCPHVCYCEGKKKKPIFSASYIQFFSISIFYRLFIVGLQWQQVQGRNLNIPSSIDTFQLVLGHSRPERIYNTSGEYWVFPGAFYQIAKPPQMTLAAEEQ